MDSDTIYHYKKIKPLEIFTDRTIRNKVNELVVEYNHLAKDFELYKKAFKEHLRRNNYDNNI